MNEGASISEQCVASVATVAPSFTASPSTSTDVLSDANKCTSSHSSQDLATNSTSTISELLRNTNNSDDPVSFPGSSVDLSDVGTWPSIQNSKND